MNNSYAQIKIDQMFQVKSGDYHANEELDSGKVPLIACGETNNGFVGYFNIPLDKTYHRAITVAYNGRPLTTKFHPYRFGAKDDVAVLLPRKSMQDTTLLFIAAQLNRMMWRYSYGRKCYREKLQNVSIHVPVIHSNGKKQTEEQIDEQYLAGLLEPSLRDLQSRVRLILDVFNFEKTGQGQ